MAESNAMRPEGITQLPGYETVRARLTPDQSGQGLPKGNIFDILRNQRRQYILRYLDEHDEVVELRDLAEALANWENEDDASTTQRARKRAYVSLYQTHLPKLDRAGVVEYNQSRATVEAGPNYRSLMSYLYHTHDSTLLWYRLYVGGAIASVSVLGLAQLTAFPFVAVSDTMWFVFVLVMVGSILLAQSIRIRIDETRTRYL